jgi:DNA-directed RNA polymerase specialized sigma subunit
MQVGYVGLLKAINSFDPERGSELAAYASGNGPLPQRQP